jgi:hypothetical protein
MNSFLELLKIFSIAVTAFLGVMGTIYDYKKDGRVTPHGRLAVIGILVFGILSMGIQFFDSMKEAQREKENNERQQQMQFELKKLSTPLQNIYFSYVISFDSADKRFPEYFERVLKARKEKGHLERKVIILPIGTMFPYEAEDSLHELVISDISVEIGLPPADILVDFVPELGYFTWATIPRYKVTPQKYNYKFHDIFTPTINLEVDLTDKVIRQHVQYTGVYKYIDSHTILSEYDLLDSNSVKDRTLYVSFNNYVSYSASEKKYFSNRKFSTPKIEEFRIILGNSMQFAEERKLFFAGSKFKLQESKDKDFLIKYYYSCPFSEAKKYK